MKIRCIAFFVLLSCRTVYSQNVPMSHESYMNLMAGMWYEVALSPAHLRKDCHCPTLEFEYIPGNTFMKVSVRCIQFKNQESKILKSRLKLYATSDSAGWFKTGRISTEYYHVLPVHDNYIMVLYNSRHDQLHILSRDSFVPVHKFNEVLKFLSDKGYKISSLQKTSQNCDIIE